MLSVLLLSLITLCSTEAVLFQIKNLEISPIWVGILENPGKTRLEDGGFILGSGISRSINVPDGWAGVLWPRTWCGWPKVHECLTGDCDKHLQCQGIEGRPPFSSINVELNGKGGLDRYSVSLVNGYNVGVTIEPINGTRNDSDYLSCAKASCIYNFQLDCPGPLRLRHENQIIACHSACMAFATDEYCCRKVPSNNQTAEICRSFEWRDIDVERFKRFCPDALVYPKDTSNILMCKAQGYRIEFGGAF